MDNPREVTCDVCGKEHDPATVPDLDSTHLCPDCSASMRRLAPVIRFPRKRR